MNDLKDILKDAARYRWMRNNLWAVEEMASIPDEGSEGTSGRYMTGCEFDAAVDKELEDE